MVYKLISEWKSQNGIEHEITIYKYNISHDEMIRYFVSVDNVRIETLMNRGNYDKTEYYLVKNELTEDEKAMVKLGA